MLHTLIHDQVFIQLIGFIALGISVIAYQIDKRITILRLQTVASLLWGVHFFLLGAWTGSILNVTGAIQNYIFSSIPNRKRTWLLPIVFILIFIIADALTWQGLLSLLPLGGTISGTISYWQKRTRLLRILALISPPLWFTYNFISHSYPGMLTEVFLISSTLIGIYRFDIRKIYHQKAVSH